MSPESERAVILGLTLAGIQNDRYSSLRWYRGTTCLFRQLNFILGDVVASGVKYLSLRASGSAMSLNVVASRPVGQVVRAALRISQQLLNN